MDFPAAIYTLTPDGIVTSWNRMATTLFGFAEGEVLGKPLPLVPEEHRLEALWFPEKMAITNPFTQLRITRQRKDGTPLQVELTASPLWDRNKQITAIVVSATDVSERMRTERALREAEERSRTIFNLLPEAMFILDPTGHIVDANQAAVSRYGYSRAELLKLNAYDISAQDHRPKVTDFIRASLEGRTHVDWRHRQKDGSEFPVVVSSHPIHLDGKEFVVSAVNDFTLRKECEEQRRQDKARVDALMAIAQYPAQNLRDLLDFTLHQGLSLVASEIGFIYLVEEDQKTLVLNSWSREAMKECATIDRPLSYYLDHTGVWGDALRNRAPVLLNDFAAPHPSKRGLPPGHVPLKRLLVAPIFDRDKVVVLVGVANKEAPYVENDITQLTLLVGEAWRLGSRREAISERLASETRYHDMVENLEEVVFSLGADGRFSYVNSAVAKFGFSPAELSGLPFTTVVFPGEEATALAAIDEALQGAFEPIELRLRDTSGNLRMGRISCRKRTRNGQVELMGTITDLTKQRQTEEQLRVAQKMEAVGLLAGGIAHDFNNLLSVIQGYANFALKSAPEIGTLRRDLLEIRNASQRATALTNQLLAFGRRQVLAPSVVDLNTTLRDFSAMVERLITGNIHLDLRTDPSLWRIKVDLGQFEQVLMNLVLNARDAMPDGGKIEIAATNVELDGNRAAEHQVPAGRFARISVQDTGSGISPDHLPRIFDPFFSTKPPGKGTGLGLATVFGIVNQSGGFIRAHSEVGRGTTFEIFLPACEQGAQASPARPRTDQSPTDGTETILLVDDEPAVRELTKRILESHGYRVTCAENGEHALVEAVRMHSPAELLVTDLAMPRLGGRDLARLLKGRWPGLQTLFMSGYTSDVGAERSQSDGGPVIPKPFSEESLLKAVRAALDDGMAERMRPPGSPSRPPSPAPPQWILATEEVARLRQAVAIADFQALLDLAETFSTRNPEFAAWLRTLTERFEYAAILDLVDTEVSGEIFIPSSLDVP